MHGGTWRRIQIKGGVWKGWYADHIHVHGVQDLLRVADNRPTHKGSQTKNLLQALRRR
jgi:hypothetical protein